MNVKTFFKQIVVYGAGKYLERALGFLLLPVFTRILTPAEYGVMDVLAVFTTASLTMVSLNINQATLRHYVDHDDPERRKTVVSTGLVFILVWCSAVVACIIAASGEIVRWLAIEGYRTEFVLASVGLLLLVYIRFLKALLRFTFRAKAFVAVSSARILIVYTGAIGSIVYLGYRLDGYYFAVVVGNIAVVCVLLFMVRHLLAVRFDGRLLRRMLIYSLPLVPYTVFGALNRGVGRLILQHFHGNAELGVFAVANRLSHITLFMVYAFTSAWAPFAMAIFKQKSAVNKFSNIFKYYVLVMGVSLFGICAFSQEIIYFVAPEIYHRAHRYVLLLSMSHFLFGLFSISAFGVMVERKTYKMTVAMASGFVINLTLGLLLGERYGMLGIGLSMIGAWTVAAIVLVLISRKDYPIDLAYSNVAILLGPTIVFSVVLYFSNPRVSWGLFAIKIVCFAAFFCYLHFTKMIPWQALASIIGRDNQSRGKG